MSAESPAENHLSRRERRKLEVRNRILEASFGLFEQQGFQATRVSEICERADVAEKTFFNYFPSKRDVLREIAGAALEQLLLDIETARKRPGSTRDRLLCFFGQVANRTAEAGPMRRELLTEIIYAGHEAGSGGEQARKLHDSFAAIVRDGIAAGDLSGSHGAETLTEMLMGAFYVLMFNWANLDAYPLERQAEAAARFLADAMTVQPQRNKRSRS
ncbi:MAG: TetR/AcrR family transcriptional regulator [Myxococcota bacterium]|nr:TetR/AcrR family transcriptional regulator [Myxococcota bacterium]